MGPLELTIDDLVLDTENPRFGRAAGQKEALQRLIDDQEEKLFTLARSIAGEGLNPMDRFLVAKQSKRYVTLEGNRRLAALKILSNPAVLTGLEIKPGLQRRFEELAVQFDKDDVEPLPCYEVADRVAGATWIHLRHTGEHEGKGVVQWSGMASSRFRGREPAMQALDLVKTHGGLTAEQKNLLEGDFPITTLDRLLASREVRKRLGFNVKDGKLITDLMSDEVIKPLRKIVIDLAENSINVSKLKNKEQQIEYITKFGPEHRPDLTKKESTRAVESIRKADFKSPPSKLGPRTKTSDPNKRSKVVPAKCTLNIDEPKIFAIFRELKGLRIDEHQNAIAVLLRVFLELSIDSYMEKNSLSTTFTQNGHKRDKKLSDKFSEVVSHLITNKGYNKKEFNAVERALYDNKSPLHIDLLHDYVHNRFVNPKSHHLIGAWNDAQRLFERIWA